MQKAPASLTGIGLMVASMACFAIMNTMIRAGSEGMPAAQLVFLRNAMALAIITPIALAGGREALRTRRLNDHFWRAAVGICAMELWFYSLSVLPLSLATALSFTSPIFATVFALLFLGERAGMRRWLAIGVGFAGALVILRPGMGEAMDINGVVVLTASALQAVAATVVKTLTRTERPETIVFYMALFMLPLSLPFALWQWRPLDSGQLVVAFGVAFFSTAAHLLLVRAYQHAPMVVLMPFDFTRLIFTAVLAYACFGETLDGPTLVGGLIIVASTVYIVHREARTKPRVPVDIEVQKD